MISCSWRIAWSTRASVEYPVLPRRLRDRPSFSKRIGASCWGEPIVNSSPASSQTRRSSSTARSLKRELIARQRQRDVGKESGQPAPLEPVALALGQQAREHRSLGDAIGAGNTRAEAELRG